jgi:hypothetical protein
MLTHRLNIIWLKIKETPPESLLLLIPKAENQERVCCFSLYCTTQKEEGTTLLAPLKFLVILLTAMLH